MIPEKVRFRKRRVTGIRNSHQRKNRDRESDETDESQRDGSRRRAAWTQRSATRMSGLMEQRLRGRQFAAPD